MSDHPSEPRMRAEAYLKGRRKIIADLGSGTDGWVFSLEPHSVVKVHESKRKFYNELNAYQRLKEHGVTKVGTLHVPELRGFDADLLIIEISFVSPPYLIDFGKSHMDDPIEFDDEGWAMWREEVQYRFGDNAPAAFSIYYQLVEKYGIYHQDLSLHNMNFGDDDL